MKKRFLILVMIISALVLVSCANTRWSESLSENKVETELDESNASESNASESNASESNVSESKNNESKDNDEIVFTDALQREVKVSNPKRVVTLLGSFCDEWMLAGGELVGTASDSFTNYDYDFGENVIDIGSHMEPDVELILSLEPDLVIASSMLDSQVELKDTLENAGITVAYFYINSFEDYLSSLDIFTKITGRADLYTKYGTEVSYEIENAKEKIDGRKPTVLFVRAAASSVKVKGSEGTVGGEILADLDTINIADSESLLEDLSMEAIIQADPDYIFVTTQGSDYEAAIANVEELMISNPAWNSLKAVQNGNYYVIEKELYNSKPNARWGEAYQKLADIIYN